MFGKEDSKSIVQHDVTVHGSIYQAHLGATIFEIIKRLAYYPGEFYVMLFNKISGKNCAYYAIGHICLLYY